MKNATAADSSQSNIRSKKELTMAKVSIKEKLLTLTLLMTKISTKRKLQKSRQKKNNDTDGKNNTKQYKNAKQ